MLGLEYSVAAIVTLALSELSSQNILLDRLGDTFLTWKPDGKARILELKDLAAACNEGQRSRCQVPLASSSSSRSRVQGSVRDSFRVYAQAHRIPFFEPRALVSNGNG